MLLPRRKTEFDLFDNMFNDPFFERGFEPIMRHEPSRIRPMSADIREKDGNYIIDMDLPGYEKENIAIELENGYLKVSAKSEFNNESKDENGSYIHRERFFGECSRNFYVGDNLKEENIKASFKNGTLTLVFPKEEEKKIESKKYIQID